MKKIIYLLLTLTILALPLPNVRAQDQHIPENPAPPGPNPVGRPNDCGNQCVTFSPDGTQIHLWYKSGRAPTDRTMNYVSISDVLNDWLAGYLPNHDIYIFRSTSEDYYIDLAEAGNNQKYEIAHFQNGENKYWDKTPRGDQPFNVVGTANNPSGTNGNNRYSWRITMSGKVELESNGTKTPANGAGMQIILDSQKGPPIGEIKAAKDTQGGFEYSGVKTWVNDDTVNNLSLYVRFSNNGLNYESYTDIPFLGDPRWHTNTSDRSNASKSIDGITITLTDANKVDKFSRDMRVGQNIKEEILGPNAGDDSIFKTLACWAKQAFVAILGFLSNTAAYFLVKNY
jgi:hypothetical protein